MGGSAGAALDTVFSAGGTLYDPKKEGIKKGAEDMQKHYGDQITNMMNAPQDALDTTTNALSEVVENQQNESPNPFSMASYGNNVRQRKKSGFGRRQTFKGLTG